MDFKNISLTKETVSPTPEVMSSILLPSLSTITGVTPEATTCTLPTIRVDMESGSALCAAPKMDPI